MKGTGGRKGRKEGRGGREGKGRNKTRERKITDYKVLDICIIRSTAV